MGAASRNRSTTVLDRCAPAISETDAAAMTPTTTANTRCVALIRRRCERATNVSAVEHSDIVPPLSRRTANREACSRLSETVVLAPGGGRRRPCEYPSAMHPIEHLRHVARSRAGSTSPSSSGRLRSRSARCTQADPTWSSRAGGSWNGTPRSVRCGGSVLGCSPRPNRAGWHGRSPTRLPPTQPPVRSPPLCPTTPRSSRSGGRRSAERR